MNQMTLLTELTSNHPSLIVWKIYSKIIFRKLISKITAFNNPDMNGGLLFFIRQLRFTHRLTRIFPGCSLIFYPNDKYILQKIELNCMYFICMHKHIQFMFIVRIATTLEHLSAYVRWSVCCSVVLSIYDFFRSSICSHTIL